MKWHPDILHLNKTIPDYLLENNAVKESELKGVSVTLYTDGASRGNLNSRTGRASSGWGFCIKSKSHARESMWTRHGGMPHATGAEAEMYAVLKALEEIRFPANALLVTDCARVIHIMNHPEKSLEKLQSIRSQPHTKLTKNDYLELSVLGIYEKIHQHVSNNRKLLSLHTRWVPSHTLDHVDSIPSPNSITDPKLKQSLEWRMGNARADEEANLGVSKGIRNQLWNLKHHRYNEMKHGKNLRQVRSNIQSSKSVAQEAAQYIIDKPDFIDQQSLDYIFPDHTVSRINKAWDRIENSHSRADYKPISAPSMSH